ncbi:hypothetical protein GOV11_04700 [Candidatus Woesearchaeota archaeon]|nr:hypothetical protein [Candidatus Woesearchaeota archaeon]
MRGQSALEFSVLVAFSLLMLTVFLHGIQGRAAFELERATILELQSLADTIELEIALADRVHAGYIRTFELPRTINGIEYVLNVYSQDEKSEIIITLNPEGRPQHIIFLELDLAPGSTLGPGNNEIRKTGGLIVTRHV